MHKSEDLKRKAVDPKDVARLESRWGKRGWREDDYLRAREGESLIVPFECDLCIFRKLKGRNPVGGRLGDDELLLTLEILNHNEKTRLRSTRRPD